MELQSLYPAKPISKAFAELFSKSDPFPFHWSFAIGYILLIFHGGGFMPENDNGKKQLPLRISKGLYEELARWAEDDFRSLNGQIEYLLTECVRRRRGIKRDADPVPEELTGKKS